MALDRLEIVEVSPRDGLQNEAVAFSTADKLQLIRLAMAAGARRLEATSFVNPRKVPQMADADAVMAGLPRQPGVSFSGLVLNLRGAERALAAGVDELNYVVVASETLSLRNNGARTSDSLDALPPIAEAAREAGKPLTVTIAAAFGCPFEGEVPESRVVAIADQVAASGPAEIALADTIGSAVPTEVTSRFKAVADVAPDIRRRAHFHNTRNAGIANAYAAVEAGVTVLDASLGGIGGCPFAPAATGNIPTEDLVWMLHRMGRQTGLDLSGLLAAAQFLEDRLGRPVPALLGRAGVFPSSPTVMAA